MSLYIGGALAFLFAALAIYVDCYQAIRKTIWCVPRQFWLSRGLACLAISCGTLAVGAFWIATVNNSGWLDNLLGSKIDNTYVRGVYTGLAVLAIVRSKLLQIKDIDVGPEFLYGESRLICLRNIRLEWASWREQFVEKNLPAVFAKNDFDERLKELIRAAVQDADPDLKTSFESQLATVTASRPQTPISSADASWVRYYRTFLTLALETCGRRSLLQAGLSG